MVNFYEDLYKIQKLLWYMRAYPDGNSEEESQLDIDLETDSPPISCIGKMMILIKLMSKNFVENISLSNDKQNVSDTLVKSFQEIQILCKRLNSKELDQENGLLRMEQIFEELAKLITKSQLSMPIKTDEINKISPGNVNHKQYYELLSDPLKHFQKCKLRNRQLEKTIVKEIKMDKKLLKENVILSRKLEKLEQQSNLELMRHKLMILKEQTLASQALVEQRKSEEIVRDLTRDLINLEVENSLLKRQKDKSPSKIVEVKPKLKENLETNLSIKHFHGINIETVVDSTKNVVTESFSERESRKKLLNQPMRMQNLYNKPRKCYPRQHYPFKIYIYRRKMSQTINNLKKSISNSNKNISKSDAIKQQKLCRDLKNNLYAIKDADDSLPHEKLEMQKKYNQQNLEENESQSVKLNLLKENAQRNALGKTFGDRRRELLRWCQIKLKPYGIPMYEFSISWTNGHALCALIHAYCPDIMDSKYISRNKPKSTLRHGVHVAKSLGVTTNFNFAKIYRSKRPNYQDVFKFVQELYYCLESMKLESSIFEN